MDNKTAEPSELTELKDARNIARELDPKILARIKEKQAAGPLPDIRKRFDAILARYAKTILASAAEPSGENAANLFELVGAMKLVKANKASRLVSTHLGSAWEEMAGLSHLAVSPEADFGVRLKGVDIVFLESGFLRHTQIKTQKNTLTGSQAGRSTSELELHPRPVFAAAFDVAAWTFTPKENSPTQNLQPRIPKTFLNWLVQVTRRNFRKLYRSLASCFAFHISIFSFRAGGSIPRYSL
ncbi:MAG: hypothetical protein HZA89_17840 [Verrucomicrobia bacterium]|nr:hypothetical protein [Verrucomicrobiota bacterium]